MKSNVLDNSILTQNLNLVTLENYHKMLDEGIVSKKTELIEGVIIEKMTKSQKHSYFSDKILELITKILPKKFFIRKENPISIFNSEPEPDIMVLEGKLSDFKKTNPKTAVLVIEIAKTSLSSDRQKIPIYASANVLNYWILDIDKMQIEVYTTPFENSYKQKTLYSKTESISIFEQKINLKDLFED